MKKIIALLTSLILVFSLFGCKQETIPPIKVGNATINGDTGGLTLPLDDNNTTLTGFVAADYEVNDLYAIQKLREVTGINYQITSVSPSTATEKFKVLLGSKQLSDIFPMVGTIGEVNDFAMQGAFAAVNDYQDVMPNFKSLFVDTKENNWILKSWQAEDGKVYVVPGYDQSRDVNHGMLYRKDIFDKHGLKMWDTPEEFYQTLKKLKELYPDSVPFVSKNQQNLVGLLGASWGGLVSNQATRTYYDEETKTWKYTDTDPQMKDLLDFLRKLCAEELLDKEFLTRTQSSWTQLMTQRDKSFVTFDWIGRLEQFKEQTKDTVPEYDLRYGNPIGPTGTIATLSKVHAAGNCVAKGKNEELAFKLQDFLLSPAGAELMTMGVEGDLYQINERGFASYPEIATDRVPSINEVGEKYGLFLFYKRMDRRSVYFDFTEREREAQEYAKDPNRMTPLDPQLTFTDEELKIVNDKLAHLVVAGDEMYVKYIMANDAEAEQIWSKWLKQAESLGANDIVKVFNEAQIRYDKE